MPRVHPDTRLSLSFALCIFTASCGDSTRNEIALARDNSAWLQSNSAPFALPGVTQSASMLWQEELRDARIIGLGESSHGVHDIFAIKRDLFLWMADTLDARVLLLEDDFSASPRIQAYLQGETSNYHEAFDGTFPHNHEPEAMRRLWENIRQHNTSQPSQPIWVFGVDPQMKLESDQRLGLLTTLAALAGNPPNQLPSGAALFVALESFQDKLTALSQASQNLSLHLKYPTSVDAQNAYASYLEKQNKALAALPELSVLLDTLPLSGHAGVFASTAVKALEFYVKATHPLRGSLSQAFITPKLIGLGSWDPQIVEDYRQLHPGSLASVFTARNLGMAEVGGHITMKSERRSVFWAHNMHVQKHRDPLGFEILKEDVKDTGGFLKEAWGDAYVALGTETASGHFAAILFHGPNPTFGIQAIPPLTNRHFAYHIEPLGLPRVVIMNDDLGNVDNLPPMLQEPKLLHAITGAVPASAATLSEFVSVSVDVSRAFDAIVVLADVEPARPTNP